MSFEINRKKIKKRLIPVNALCALQSVHGGTSSKIKPQIIIYFCGRSKQVARVRVADVLNICLA